jgi:hypothetical protein
LNWCYPSNDAIEGRHSISGEQGRHCAPLEIHQLVAGKGDGRKYGVEVLNRAALVFISACWESYVEDVALEGFDVLVVNAPAADKVPGKLRALASDPLRIDKDTRAVWKLADNGWRAVITDYMLTAKTKWKGDFNTPKTAQVRTLFQDLLDINNLPSSWSWTGMKSEQAGKKLDEYITIRGNIAHRIKHDEAVYKNWSVDFLGHVQRLVERTDETVKQHLTTVTGASPW